MEYNQKKVYSEGAEAYRSGKSVEDNPYDEKTHHRIWYDWNFAYLKEEEYWESM